MSATETIKGLIRKNATVFDLVRAIQAATHRWSGLARMNFDVADQLCAFAPNSMGPMRASAAVALQSARRTFPLLVSLAQASGKRLPQPTTIAGVYPKCDALADTAEFASLMNRYGSDKADGRHDYHRFYAPLLATKRRDPLRLFEIGLGTNNTDVLSNMGSRGRPGASLRAFRDFLPNAQIFGADVDRRVWFREDRITTAFVDQRDAGTFSDLPFEPGFDIIIDDGLHSPEANLETLLFALRALAPGGSLVIEDIREEAVSIWQIVSLVLPAALDPVIVSARNGFLFKIGA